MSTESTGSVSTESTGSMSGFDAAHTVSTGSI